jgi:hypothetical protein
MTTPLSPPLTVLGPLGPYAHEIRRQDGQCYAVMHALKRNRSEYCCLPAVWPAHYDEITVYRLEFFTCTGMHKKDKYETKESSEAYAQAQWLIIRPPHHVKGCHQAF